MKQFIVIGIISLTIIGCGLGTYNENINKPFEIKEIESDINASYGNIQTKASYNEYENEIFSFINSQLKENGFPSLILDNQLTLTAQKYSELFKDKRCFEGESDIRQYYLWRNGVIDVSPFSSSYCLSSIEEFEEFFKRDILSGIINKEVSNIGIGVIRDVDNGTFWITLIFIKRWVEIASFPRVANLNTKYELRGKLKKGLNNGKVIIGLPNGGVEELDTAQQNSDFSTTIFFNQGKGEYQIQIIGEGSLGPTEVALFPVYVNISPPNKIVRVTAKKESYLVTRQAEKDMFNLINRDRAKYGLHRLIWEEKLCQVAKKHSIDMRDNCFFAHISPTYGTLDNRIEKSEIFASNVGENIALGFSVAEEEKDLMNSPGHRKNILDKNFTHIGVGIEWKKEGRKNVMFITQTFAKLIEKVLPRKAEKSILRLINKERRNKRLIILKEDLVLSKIAREYSKKISETGSSYVSQELFDTIKKEIGESEYSHGGIGNNPFISYSIEDVLKSENVLDPSYDKIGVGVVQQLKNVGEVSKGQLCITLIFWAEGR